MARQGNAGVYRVSIKLSPIILNDMNGPELFNWRVNKVRSLIKGVNPVLVSVDDSDDTPFFVRFQRITGMNVREWENARKRYGIGIFNTDTHIEAFGDWLLCDFGENNLKLYRVGNICRILNPDTNFDINSKLTAHSAKYIADKVRKVAGAPDYDDRAANIVEDRLREWFIVSCARGDYDDMNELKEVANIINDLLEFFYERWEYKI